MMTKTPLWLACVHNCRNVFVTLTTTPPSIFKGLTTKRINRICEDIIPLMAQGLTNREIAEAIGISESQTNLDVQLAKEFWAENYVKESVERVRGEAIARMDYVYAQSLQAWAYSKKMGNPVGKFLDVAVVAAKEKVKLSGAEIDLKIVQQNVNVTMASAEEVASTFEPMSSTDFAAFAAAHVEAQARAAAATKAIMPEPAPIAVSDDSDEVSESDWTGEVSGSGHHATAENGDDRGAPRKNRRVRHPLR